MAAKKRLLFYCQHVLGMGHFIRSAEIVRGLNRFDVTFLNGGELVPGFELPASVEVVHLPPIKSDAEFRGIEAADGAASLEQIKALRIERILAEYDHVRPDVLVVELFPFGRAKFAFELMPLLERAKAGQTKIVCSLRDILVAKRKQEAFEERACQIVNQYFDLLLVHSDPRFQRLEETFTNVHRIDRPLRYTGFVAQPAAVEAAVEDERLEGGGEKRILVSIGGGRVGVELIECAIDASALLAERLPHQMLMFAGPYLPENEFQRLREKIAFVVSPSGGKQGAPDSSTMAGTTNITLARYTTRFLSHLQRTDLSISMAGYNTCMNIVAAGVRAIVYPFTGGGNQEQTLRAEKLRALGLVEMIREAELTPVELAEKMAHALSKPTPPAAALDLTGVEKTAAALWELIGGSDE